MRRLLLLLLSVCLSVALADAASVTLHWKPLARRAVPGTRVAVYRQADCAGDFARIATVAATEKQYEDATVQPGSKYCYQVTVLYTSGEESNPSASVTEDIPDPASEGPTDLRSQYKP